MWSLRPFCQPQNPVKSPSFKTNMFQQKGLLSLSDPSSYRNDLRYPHCVPVWIEYEIEPSDCVYTTSPQIWQLFNSPIHLIQGISIKTDEIEIQSQGLFYSALKWRRICTVLPGGATWDM